MDARTAPRRQRPLVVGLCLFFLALSVPYAFKVKDDARSAFVRWRPQILDLTAGVNVYERHNYPNPPIMALVLTPLALLPPLTGSLLWFFLKAGMGVLAIHWALGLVETPSRPFPAWARLLAVLLGLRPIVGDLTHGNVNVFILFLVVAALRAFCRRREVSAGLLLALAVACKVTPALFIPYFVWKRAWKTLAGCAAGLALFLWLVPACFLGAGANAELVGSWVERMVVPYLEGAVTTEHQNQSLPGVVYRLTTDAASFSTYHEGIGYVPTEHHNVVSLPAELVPWLVRGCMAAFALLVVWSCRTAPRGGKPWRLAAEFSLVLLGMLLFSERSWKHHHVTLILPLAVLLYRLATAGPGGPRRLVLGTLTLAFLLMASTGTGIPGLPERAGKLAEVYGAFLWADLLLVAGLVVVLRGRDTPAAGNQDRVLAMRVAVQGERAGAASGVGPVSRGRQPPEAHPPGADAPGSPSHASMSVTTDAPGTSDRGRPVRSVRVASGSMPSRW
jgi:hypothetical protein